MKNIVQFSVNTQPFAAGHSLFVHGKVQLNHFAAL